MQSAFLVKTMGGSMLVSGDIAAWLSDRGAVPRKAGGYTISRRVVFVEPITLEILSRLAIIFPAGAAAKALDELAGLSSPTPGGA